MQGIYIDNRRPASKAEIKRTITEGRADRITIEPTSLFGNEYGGPVAEIPEGQTIYFVGPDPYTSRKFYGQLTRVADAIKVK